MKKIGLVSIDTSHPLKYAQNTEMFPEFGLKYSMIYEDGFRTDAEVEWFIKKFGLCGRAKTTAELAEKTDIGFFQGCNWDKKIDQAMPFIERGKPVFIDKPFVGSVKDINRVRELVKQGARLLGASAARYAEELHSFLSLPEDERGEVVTAYVVSGVNEFDYAIHAGEILSEIAGAPAVSCKFIGKVEVGGGCEQYSARFANGMIGIYCTEFSKWRPFTVTIVTTKTTYSTTINSAALYKQMLLRISKALERGDSTVTDVETLLNVTQMLLCGKRSRDFEDGREVNIEELLEDDAFDGFAFEKEYAASAKALYKD